VLLQPTGISDLGGAGNLVDALFGMEMLTTDTCTESPDEPPKTSKECARKLVVNITGGNAAGATVTGNVDHLHEGGSHCCCCVESFYDAFCSWTRVSRMMLLCNVMLCLMNYLFLVFISFAYVALLRLPPRPGVKIGLTNSIEMTASTLDRNALWTRSTRINRLPRYICVQVGGCLLPDMKSSVFYRRCCYPCARYVS